MDLLNAELDFYKHEIGRLESKLELQELKGHRSHADKVTKVSFRLLLLDDLMVTRYLVHRKRITKRIGLSVKKDKQYQVSNIR